MAKKAGMTFRSVPRLQAGRGRAVGFLEGHGELNGGSEFDSLGVSDERAMRANMEHWVAGNNQPTTRFHGFPSDPDHEHCFVFKHGEHRFYGFLCHPRPKTNPRFQLCVICIYVPKHQWKTEAAVLNRVKGWLIASGAVAAIKQIYPEFRGEGVKRTI